MSSSSVISEDLLRLNSYFKTVMDMIPQGMYQINGSNDDNKKKLVENILTVSGRKAEAKRQKMNPKYMKVLSETREEESSDGENVPSKRSKTVLKDSCSLEELHEKLKKRIEEMKMQRTSKNPNKKKKIKSSQSKLGNAKNKHKMNKAVKARTEDPLSEKIENKKTTIVANSENIVTKEGKVVFSKFDFGQMFGKVSKEDAKQKHKLPKGKDYKTLLARAVNEKEKIEQLKKENPEKASALIQKKSWSKAVAKAEGMKVKDDPELLKKSLKRKLQMKKQSAKKWKEREDAVHEKLLNKQEKRKENIQKKIEQRKNKKGMKRGKRKATPGF